MVFIVRIKWSVFKENTSTSDSICWIANHIKYKNWKWAKYELNYLLGYKGEVQKEALKLKQLPFYKIRERIMRGFYG